MITTFDKGRRGEQRAADFLIADGWNIVQKNFRGRRGEVDIIAVRDDVISFVEVKSWETLPPESLEYAISRRKLQRITGASREFLARNPDFDGFQARFEVLFVSGNRIERISDVLE
ncbi:MAG: YraN family protein [Spirochaetaceae bacterium]|nr:MAG: YraN family protein [Spirochaetaceae bacterium]